MDAVLYDCLREEMHRDAVRVERRLEKLRNVESFLLRQIQTSRNLLSYQAVLNDLATEIGDAEERPAALLHLSRFVTRALIAAYAAEPAPNLLAVSRENKAVRKPEISPVPLPALPRIELDVASFPMRNVCPKSRSEAENASKVPPGENAPEPEPPAK